MPRARKLPYFVVKTSKIHGKGAFATRPIPRGVCITEYVGELIDDEEAGRRYGDSDLDEHHTFLFGVGDGYALDAGVGGNDARFINHACEPNCEAIEYDGMRVFIHSLRAIRPGEELVYDYSLGVGRKPTKQDIKYHPCRCGAPTCRGTTLALPKKKAAPKKAAPKKAAPKKATTTRATSKTKRPASAKKAGARARA